MAEASLEAVATPRLRKVRKGTQSCWECKRRKIRCTFTAPRDTTCNGCKRRGTTCIGQDHPDISTSGSPRQYADRLCRVEGLVEQLVKKVDFCIDSGHTRCSSQHGKDLPGQHRSPALNGYGLGDNSSREDYFTPVLSTIHASGPDTTTIQETIRHLHSRKFGPAQNMHRVVSDSTQTALTPNFQSPSHSEEVCSKLIAAWPNERDLDFVLSVPVDMGTCIHGLMYSSRASNQNKKISSPREILQLPSSDSHPVLIARKLLILGSYLQAFSPSSIRTVKDLGVRYYDIMSRAIDSAHTFVLCDDEFVDSIEGIECITIESHYQNNTGDLRRAWSCNRRALTIAQMMGLHRADNRSSTKSLEPHTGASPDELWFHLIQFDRYLSLMLGLPQYVSEIDFATPDALKACMPIERLQRIDCAAGALILDRKEADINDMAALQKIDKLLRKAAASMPSQWWLIPNIGDKMESSLNIDRLYVQFVHYHFIARLHLPYLLRYSAGGKYDSSKITVANACREILARFVAFRSSNPTLSYCCGVNFIVFLACTILCLAHMNAHRRIDGHTGGLEEGSIFDFLAHQRPVDRGMMEHALESIQQMGRDSDDLTASRIATAVQHLLQIEGDSADGGSYIASASTSCGEEPECGGRLSEEGNVLHLHVPSLGAIKIKRDDTWRSDPTVSTARVAGVPSPLAAQTPHPDPRMFLNAPPPTEGQNESFASSLDFDAEDWALQGVDMALFDSLIQGSGLDNEMS